MVSSDVFQMKMDENLNQKILKFLPRRNNIFFVNTGNFEKEFALAYPIFKSVDIQRKLLHGLVLNFLERKPTGVWCLRIVVPILTMTRFFGASRPSRPVLYS